MVTPVRDAAIRDRLQAALRAVCHDNAVRLLGL
jgi:hypothetical protein